MTRSHRLRQSAIPLLAIALMMVVTLASTVAQQPQPECHANFERALTKILSPLLQRDANRWIVSKPQKVGDLYEALTIAETCEGLAGRFPRRDSTKNTVDAQSQLQNWVNQGLIEIVNPPNGPLQVKISVPSASTAGALSDKLVGKLEAIQRALDEINQRLSESTSASTPSPPPPLPSAAAASGTSFVDLLLLVVVTVLVATLLLTVAVQAARHGVLARVLKGRGRKYDSDDEPVPASAKSWKNLIPRNPERHPYGGGQPSEENKKILQVVEKVQSAIEELQHTVKDLERTISSLDVGYSEVRSQVDTLPERLVQRFKSEVGGESALPSEAATVSQAVDLMAETVDSGEVSPAGRALQAVDPASERALTTTTPDELTPSTAAPPMRESGLRNNWGAAETVLGKNVIDDWHKAVENHDDAWFRHHYQPKILKILDHKLWEIGGPASDEHDLWAIPVRPSVQADNSTQEEWLVLPPVKLNYALLCANNNVYARKIYQNVLDVRSGAPVEVQPALMRSSGDRPNGLEMVKKGTLVLTGK